MCAAQGEAADDCGVLFCFVLLFSVYFVSSVFVYLWSWSILYFVIFKLHCL